MLLTELGPRGYEEREAVGPRPGGAIDDVQSEIDGAHDRPLRPAQHLGAHRRTADALGAPVGRPDLHGLTAFERETTFGHRGLAVGGAQREIEAGRRAAVLDLHLAAAVGQPDLQLVSRDHGDVLQLEGAGTRGDLLAARDRHGHPLGAGVTRQVEREVGLASFRPDADTVSRPPPVVGEVSAIAAIGECMAQRY